MKILSMTATFGKLNRESLTLEPGLNIIDAPNEWGKSTWCAFVMAMLYGIDTSKKKSKDESYLTDKERYAPWSGEPMAGTMEILWNDRQITIQRQSNARTPLGDVKAIETLTGLPVPELEIEAPGLVLLGVEKNVFAQAGFIRQSQMPVADDEALRRRLNALVTTGDESGASDGLAKKLKDLKNECYSNRTNGLIPKAENSLNEINDKLEKLLNLQQQVEALTQKESQLQEDEKTLKNHKQALEYAEQQEYAKKLAAAQVRRDTQAETLQQIQTLCADLPAQEKLQAELAAVQQLRESREALQTQAQLLPPVPQEPMVSDAFRGKDPQTVESDTARDVREYIQLTKTKKTPVLEIAGGVSLAAGVVLALLVQPIVGALLAVAGIALVAYGILKQQNLQKQIAVIAARYAGIAFDRWVSAAAEYARAQQAYRKALQDRQDQADGLNRRLAEITAKINTLTENQGINAFEDRCRQALQTYNRLEEQQRLLQQAEDVLQALRGAGKLVEQPQFADTRTETMTETDTLIADNGLQQRQLREQLGKHQGEMNSLGQAEPLQVQKTQLETRIEKLKLYKDAVEYAQETLNQATQELQRRFAPQITRRAQEILSGMTQGRYQRLTMDDKFLLHVGAADEVGNRKIHWRSDGTVDQIYLSLRMAVAEALTPDAPLVLDDALVSFDDTRLAAALSLLQQESAEKQIILFSCHSRERKMQEEME